MHIVMYVYTCNNGSDSYVYLEYYNLNISPPFDLVQNTCMNRYSVLYWIYIYVYIYMHDVAPQRL